MPSVLALACASAPAAQDAHEAGSTDTKGTPYDRGRFTLDIANDDFGSAVDEAFTSGIEIVIRFTPSSKLALSSLHPALSERRVREYWGFLLGQEIHTPALLQVTDLEILRRDRRYAGWLYAGLRAELALAHSPFATGGYSLYRIQLSFGSTGPRTETAALQRYWHAFIRDVLNRRRLPEDPKGWAIYQVPNHWGVTLDVSQEVDIYRWSAGDAGLRRSVGTDFGVRVASLARARLGNMWIDATLGATVRAGLMPELVFDDLALPVPYGASEGTSSMPPLTFAVYGFVSGRVRGVVYNALLDGPPGFDGPNPDRNPSLARLEAGFAIRVGMAELMFRHVTLSPELRDRPPGGVWIQNWGRFTVSVFFY